MSWSLAGGPALARAPRPLTGASLLPSGPLPSLCLPGGGGRAGRWQRGQATKPRQDRGMGAKCRGDAASLACSPGCLSDSLTGSG